VWDSNSRCSSWRGDHYRLAAMAVTPSMWIGMALMFAGAALTIYALFH
jgi:hypothetical protein